MADEILKRDQNFVTVLAGVTNDSDLDVTMLRVDPISKRLLVSASGGGGTPGGSDTQVQFNDSGSFGGDAGFTYDKVTGQVTVTQNVVAGEFEATTGIMYFDGDQFAGGTGQLFRLIADILGGDTARLRLSELGGWANTVFVVDGDINFTGATYTGQITSTAATGTAPFVVASTTVVTNLNADTVDGFSLDQGVLTSSSPTFSRLNLSATSNQLVFQSAGVTGTLTWAPATSNKTITLPNNTGTVALLNGTQSFTGAVNVAGTLTATGSNGIIINSASPGLNLTESGGLVNWKLYSSSAVLILEELVNGGAPLIFDYGMGTITLGDSAGFNGILNLDANNNIDLQIATVAQVSVTSGAMTMTDAVNIPVGSTTGTKIATATSQKLAFHNSTPVVQRVGAAQAAVATTAATDITPFGYTTQAQADAIVTLVNELRAALVEKGLIKGAA